MGRALSPLARPPGSAVQPRRQRAAGEMVVDAAHHERAAVARLRGADLVGGEPQRAHDLAVERATGQRLAHAAAVGDAQVGHVLGIATGPRRPLEARQVQPQQRLGHEGARRLLERLAHHAFERRLARLEVAGRVVEAQALGRLLLDEQEARHRAVVGDDGGDGDARAPAGGHLGAAPGADIAGDASQGRPA
jgi:hypothetical protein